jgi:hypothetical protein
MHIFDCTVGKTRGLRECPQAPRVEVPRVNRPEKECAIVLGKKLEHPVVEIRRAEEQLSPNLQHPPDFA